MKSFVFVPPTLAKEWKDALKELPDLEPGSTETWEGTKDAGPLVEALFREAGFELQLRQHGIAGTVVLAVPLEPQERELPPEAAGTKPQGDE